MSLPRGKDFWGPPTWATYHTFSLTTPVNNNFEIDAYLHFTFLLSKLLPCGVCRPNYTAKLEHYPIREYIRTNQLFLHSYTVHDAANRDISVKSGKKKESPVYEEVYRFYATNIRDKGIKFYMLPVWTMIHSFAASLSLENIGFFRHFLEVISILIPDKRYAALFAKALRDVDIKQYLIDKDTAFYGTYILHNQVNKLRGKTSPPFDNVKSFYYRALGIECKSCRI